MNVRGWHSKTRRPLRSARATRALNFRSFRQSAFQRAASFSTSEYPALWRVFAYSAPGLPRPTMRNTFSIRERKFVSGERTASAECAGAPAPEANRRGVAGHARRVCSHKIISFSPPVFSRRPCPGQLRPFPARPSRRLSRRPWPGPFRRAWRRPFRPWPGPPLPRLLPSFP